MDLAIRNAKVWTVDDRRPTAEAVGVRDGRIAAVGDDRDVRDAVGTGAVEIDAGGNTVLPGFIDAHNHLRTGADDDAVQLGDAATLDAVRAAIDRYASEHPEVRGMGTTLTAAGVHGPNLFLAQVGMASGPKFAATVTETGLVMLGLGAIVLVALVLPILTLGLFFFRMPFDEVAGIVAGACGNPAILAYANKLTPTDRPDIGYAMIFPAMTIVKILFVDIVPAFF